MADDERRTIAEFTEEFLRQPKRPEPTLAETLEEIRSALKLHRTITQLRIGEYQLSVFVSGGVSVISNYGLDLMSPEGKLERLDADFRERSVDAYAICRIVGDDVTDVDFDAAGNFVLRLDTGDTLSAPKVQDFENYTLITPSGVHIY